MSLARQSIGGQSGLDPNEPLIPGNMSIVSSDEDDFEKGGNQQQRDDEIDIEDEHGFINIVNNEEEGHIIKDNEESENEEMSLQQKQNLFVRHQFGDKICRLSILC